jgi:hypothetical protein
MKKVARYKLIWNTKSSSMGVRQEPNERQLPIHWLFWWPTGPLQTKNLCNGSLNISLDTPSYSALPFFEHAWSKGDLLKKDRKYLAFGKEKINSSKDSFGFVFLWVEVACLKNNGVDSPS